jgi:hypothetical protein
MITKGIISGKTFRGTNPTKDGVSYGPNMHKLPKHPVEDLINKTAGESSTWFEPNGQVVIPPEKIEYLKS